VDLETGIRSRRSVRQFTDAPIPEQSIREVLDVARWAPSWANTQGWSILVVTGTRLEKIKAAYRAKSDGKAERHFDLPPPRPDWPAHLRGRTQQLIAARRAATGTTLSYPPPLPIDLFGAPCMVFFAIERRLQPEYACFDAGLLVQTFCLAAHGRGLGTCVMAMAVAYSEVLHEILPEAQDQRFVVGVAVGVPDWQAATNTFERQRASLEELVTWLK
jgi:nitroreductase